MEGYLHSESGWGGWREGDTVWVVLLHCHYIPTYQANHSMVGDKPTGNEHTHTVPSLINHGCGVK